MFQKAFPTAGFLFISILAFPQGEGQKSVLINRTACPENRFNG